MAIREKIRIEDMNESQKEELLSEIAEISKKYSLNPRVLLEKFIANSDLGVSVINAMTHKREEELLSIMIDTLGPEYVKNIALNDLFDKYTKLLKEKARLQREIALFLGDEDFSDTMRIGNMELLLLQLRDLDEQPVIENELEAIDTYMNLKEMTILTILSKLTKHEPVRLNAQQMNIVIEKIGLNTYEKIAASYQNGTIAVSKIIMGIIMDITRKRILASKNAKVLEELKDVYFNGNIPDNNFVKNNGDDLPPEKGPRLIYTK